MKQVGQRARDGVVTVMEVPGPEMGPGRVLVETRCSLISAGTERTKVEMGSKNLVQKARARPDLVRKVIDQTRVQGVRAAAAVVRDRLDAQAPIGYSSAGVVRTVGKGVEGLQPGDRVACGGAEWANHAELVSVPMNLVVRLPDGVDFETGAYATVGSIALHGVRQSGASVGDVVGVIGLGLVGQLAVRLLRAAGCQVVGIDLTDDAVALASAGGALAVRRDDVAIDQKVFEATRGLGLDSALICASARSVDPLNLAARLARDRGRLVVIGDVPIEAERALLYEKELELRVSRSYGAGRYDKDYEEKGRDLPAGYVRWTEQRNMASFVDLAATERLEVRTLTTHRFAVENAADAYAALVDDAGRRAFGIILEYKGSVPEAVGAGARPNAMRDVARAGARVGFIGAGNFTRATLIPAFVSAGAELVAVASSSGLTASDAAQRLGIRRADHAEAILGADDVDAVVIGTRHGSHATLVAAALRAGKAVFVEKPLALSSEELDDVEAALAQSNLPLMVGFNRRFAPLSIRLRQELEGFADKVVSIRVSAGPLPTDHWLHDPDEGGGRLLGEGCHFVDLVSHLAASPIVAVQAFAVPQAERALDCSDSFTANIRLADGGVGSVVYSGGGDVRLPKERIEAFGGGIAAVLDDFRRLEIRSGGSRHVEKAAHDKGHQSEVSAFVSVVRGIQPPPHVSTYLNSSRATLALARSLRTQSIVEVE